VAAPLEVDLPCCDVCGRVGKLPIGYAPGVHACVGPRDAPHKRTAMKARRFVEKRGHTAPERRSRAPG